jgi:ribosomal protein S18 acetylase RimI-like enzyme
VQSRVHPEVTVRPRGTGDEAFIARLGALVFAEFSRNAAETTLGMTRSHLTLIATRGDRPIGLVVIEHASAGIAYLRAIAVSEDERGHGVGKLLLARAEREARAGGARGLRLHTATANLAALELFLKSGFRVERRLPRFYREVYEACQLTKIWAET